MLNLYISIKKIFYQNEDDSVEENKGKNVLSSERSVWCACLLKPLHRKENTERYDSWWAIQGSNL